MIVGVDLAAKEKNPTGICVLNKKLKAKVLFKDKEILDLIRDFKPKIIVFDAPLSIEIPFRECERELLKLGFRPLPLSIKSMRELSFRAQKLINEIKKIYNNDVIILETFPRAIEKMLNLNYKRYKKLFKTKHEYDAWLCAIIGKLYILKKYLDLGGIIIPHI